MFYRVMLFVFLMLSFLLQDVSLFSHGTAEKEEQSGEETVDIDERTDFALR